MLTRNIEVFGRIKPAPKHSQIKEFGVEEGKDGDTLLFTEGKHSSLTRAFKFRKIFQSPQSTQEDVFEYAAKPVLENVLTGFNGTIFAYGQTGTGKTYTMTGDFTVYRDRGIIPRTIQFLFHSLKNSSTVTISYFEIYNEHGYDLIGFQPSANTVELQQVNVLEDSKGNLHFRNLSAHTVRSVQEALDLLLFGDGNRMVAETVSNLRSSRSHTVFVVTLDSADPAGDGSVRSTLHLVDLAGSERLGKTGSGPSNSWESRYINLSLHYLEQVLIALGEPRRMHIPYRNSLMTTVLKNSLGGNCCTSMIATFSCEEKDFEETLQTCRFSQRVALVRNEAKVNELTGISREIFFLKRENEYLKSQLRELQAHQSLEENSQEELLEKDKAECYERVNDFLVDPDFASLPLNNSRKTEYCFNLMREEILKLRSEYSGKPDAYSAVPVAAIIPPIYVSQQRFPRGRVGITGRKPASVLRKRRVVMDLPKVNVVYKKYRSTDVAQNIRGGSRIYVEDGFGRKVVPEEVPQKLAVVERPGSSQETAESAPEEPARSERTPEVEDEQTGSDDLRSESSGRFSATELPLTGDIEVDEEIIKFYRARYRKFKSKE